MKKYNVGRKLVHTLDQLYAKASSAVLVQSKIGEWFHTSVEVCQGYLLSPTLFNIFLERIMTDALEDLTSTVNIGGRTITNLRFADNIDGLAGEEEELVNLVNRPDETSARYGTEISTEKTKIMTNISNISRSRITADGLELETVKQFKYLGAIISDEGSKVCTNINSIGETETNMERQEHCVEVQNEACTCIGPFHLPVCM